MMNKSTIKILALSIPILLAAACGGSNDSTGTAGPALPNTQIVTLDARGQDIYDTNCMVCHGMPGTGAPQSGTPSDWRERSTKGMHVVLNNAMDGFQAMPPMGGCFDCTEEDFTQLITFMTNGMLK